MNIGFTGPQRSMTARQKAALSNLLVAFKKEGRIFRHGDCIGADDQAHNQALYLGYKIIIHPPIKENKRAFCKGAWKIEEPKDYLPRNRDIVFNSDILIASPKLKDFPENSTIYHLRLREYLRSGTWATVRYARDRNLPVIILDP